MKQHFKYLVYALVMAAVVFLSGCSCFNEGITKPSSTQAVIAEVQNPKLIATGSTAWKYADDNMDPAKGKQMRTAWTLQSFDDGNWKFAKGSFGAEQGKKRQLKGGYFPQVLLTQYAGKDVNIPCYFFRSSFKIVTPEAVKTLVGELVFDDSVVIYINGVPVYSNNVPDEAYVNNLSYAADEPVDAPDKVQFVIRDTSMLVAGENTIAVELHQINQESSDVYFDFQSLKIEDTVQTNGANEVAPYLLEEQDAIDLKTFTFQLGENEKGIHANYYSQKDAEYTFCIAREGTEVKDGYPIFYDTYRMQKAAVDETGIYRYAAAVSDLQPGMYYSYWVTDGYTASKVRRFQAANTPYDDFTFLFAGDPQFCQDTYEQDLKKLNHAFRSVLRSGITPSFVITAGDQVDVPDDAAAFQAFLSADLFKNIPFVPNLGNHEKGGLYFDFFHMPNQTATGDYYFSYGDVLFIAIDSNGEDFEEHKAFLKDTIDKNSSKWVFVTMHHSIFGSGEHDDSEQVEELKKEYVQCFKDLDVDVVLSGHNHAYSRSYLMDGMQAVYQKGKQVPYREVEKAAGQTLYLTAGSSTGSKFYSDITQDAQNDETAVFYNKEEASIVTVAVKASEVVITTYRVGDMAVIDQFTLRK